MENYEIINGDYIMMEVFDNNKIVFKYSSKWKVQDPKVNGENCIKALAKVVDNIPTTITVFEFPEENDLAEIKETIEKNSDGQGWKIKSIEIKEISGNKTIDMVANAEENGIKLELHTFSTLNNGFMYVFELMSFHDSKIAEDEFYEIYNTLEFY